MGHNNPPEVKRVVSFATVKHFTFDKKKIWKDYMERKLNRSPYCVLNYSLFLVFWGFCISNWIATLDWFIWLWALIAIINALVSVSVQVVHRIWQYTLTRMDPVESTLVSSHPWVLTALFSSHMDLQVRVAKVNQNFEKYKMWGFLKIRKIEIRFQCFTNFCT